MPEIVLLHCKCQQQRNRIYSVFHACPDHKSPNDYPTWNNLTLFDCSIRWYCINHIIYTILNIERCISPQYGPLHLHFNLPGSTFVLRQPVFIQIFYFQDEVSPIIINSLKHSHIIHSFIQIFRNQAITIVPTSKLFPL